MKIYLASSWKNKEIVDFIASELRGQGHEVDNFSDSSNGRFVFDWRELKLNNINAKTFLNDKRTQRAFQEDKKMIEWADAIVMIMPCGRSSHLEMGYAIGKGKRSIIYYPHGFVPGEFETMYGFADLITDSLTDVLFELLIWEDKI